MKRFEIAKIKAREVFNSRGYPTVEVDVLTKGGILGRANVPSGTSIGKYEVVELRNGDYRLNGKGVLKAVNNVNIIIAPKLKGRDVREQRKIDELMIEIDGTENKSRLGGNAILAVSLAVAKAATNALNVPLYRYVRDARAPLSLPTPMFNVLPGDEYVGLDFEDYMIMPTGLRFSEGLTMSIEVYYELTSILKKRYGEAKPFKNSHPLGATHDALDCIMMAIEKRGYGKNFMLALDVAANRLYNADKGVYTLMGNAVSSSQLMAFYRDLVTTYPIYSIEDPFHEDDFRSFAQMTKELNIQIAGDDIFATNIKRLRKGIKMGAGNAIVWKVNQAGTLSEALDVAQVASRNSYAIIVSRRSGDTEDPIIADLAVGIGAQQIKMRLAGSENFSKLNELIRIEEDLRSTNTTMRFAE